MKVLKCKLFDGTDPYSLNKSMDYFLRVNEIEEEDVISIQFSAAGTKSWTSNHVLISYMEEVEIEDT